MKTKMKEKLAVKKMNPEVFNLRRRVMAHIYEAKALVPSLPRIEIRIGDDHETTLACAWLKTNKIRVSSRAVTASEFDLRTIVFHEIVHAVTGFKHDEKCPLMRPLHKPLTKAQAEKHFLKYFR